MDSQILQNQLENQQITFTGAAVRDINRALILGLCAYAEMDAVRQRAEADGLMGRPWEPGTVPIDPGESTLKDMADAFLWILHAEPTIEAES